MAQNKRPATAASTTTTPTQTGKALSHLSSWATTLNAYVVGTASRDTPNTLVADENDDMTWFRDGPALRSSMMKRPWRVVQRLSKKSLRLPRPRCFPCSSRSAYSSEKTEENKLPTTENTGSSRRRLEILARVQLVQFTSLHCVAPTQVSNSGASTLYLQREVTKRAAQLRRYKIAQLNCYASLISVATA